MDSLAGAAAVAAGFGDGAADVDAVLPDVAGIVVRNAAIDAGLLARARSLRAIARVGVGTDTIDVAAATARGIPVAITPEANYQAVAEHTFALLLALERRLVVGDRAVRRGRFADRNALMGRSLHRRRLGLVGYGRIGREVARIARDGFGMAVAAYDPALSDPDAGVTAPPDLAALLAAADVVSLHAPLTDATRGLIDGAALAHVKPGAVLINTARAGLIDRDALLAALDDGRLAGAAIDVFDGAPQPGDPLLARDDVVLTPHVAALTDQAFARMSGDAVAALLALLRGDRPPGIVNPQVWQTGQTTAGGQAG